MRHCSTCKEPGHYAPRCPKKKRKKAAPVERPRPDPAPCVCDAKPRAMTAEELAKVVEVSAPKRWLPCEGGIPFFACLCIYHPCERCGQTHPVREGEPCPPDVVADAVARYVVQVLEGQQKAANAAEERR